AALRARRFRSGQFPAGLPAHFTAVSAAPKSLRRRRAHERRDPRDAGGAENRDLFFHASRLAVGVSFLRRTGFSLADPVVVRFSRTGKTRGLLATANDDDCRKRRTAASRRHWSPRILGGGWC